MLRYKTETRPGLVALYDIRPGNGAGQFLHPPEPARGVGLQVCMSLMSTHHSQLFILWMDVRSRKIGSQDCNRVITEFALY